MDDLILHSAVGRFFSGDDRMVRTAGITDSLIAGQDRPLAAIALDHDALGMPPVDPAEAHLLNLVASFGVSDHPRHPSSFPCRRCRGSGNVIYNIRGRCPLLGLHLVPKTKKGSGPLHQPDEA